MQKIAIAILALVPTLASAQGLADVAAQEAARRAEAPKAERSYKAVGEPQWPTPVPQQPKASKDADLRHCETIAKQSVITSFDRAASKERMNEVRRCTQVFQDRAAAIKAGR